MPTPARAAVAQVVITNAGNGPITIASATSGEIGDSANWPRNALPAVR
jgi:hypothetical protein